ncbi:MAG: PilT/PilU family type 4a pilus ATPase [Nitriliruptoraceae bacterium]
MASLAELLVSQGVVDGEALSRAESHAAETGTNLAQSLIALGLASEGDLVRAFASSVGLPYTDVTPDAIDRHAVALLEPAVARELTVLPVGFGSDDEVVVAFADPGAQDALRDRLEVEIGLPVVLALAPRRALQEAIAVHAGSVGNGAPTGSVAPPPAPMGASATASDGTSASTNGNAAAANGAAAGSNGSAAGVPVRPPSRLEREPQAEVNEGPRVMSEEESAIDLDALLRTLVERGGSDLHLTSGIPPAIRINGEMTLLDDYDKLEGDELQKLLYAIMTQKQREAFENELELDMSYSVRGVARFRVNVFQQRDTMGSVMRVIPFEILPLEKLGIPEQVANFAYLPRGFVLVTGPTGSGKSTTLASLIDLANRNRAAHIMTVEDPIEFLHHHKASVVNQREVGTDTHGFAAALKHVLRQDPDIILVGEMRDLETIQIALTAAETGHLVFGTLHTQDAPQSIDRIIDVFPPHQQEQIKVQLSSVLEGIISQQLMAKKLEKGRVAAFEIMTATPAIRNLVREGKTHQIYSAIQAGAKDGMVAMDQSLATLVKQNRISYDAALEKCSNVNEFNRLAGRA